MTSRERVLASLNHRLPDKIPIDFSGHRSSGISALAYPKLRQYLRLPPRPIRVYDLVQQLAIMDDDVLGRFGVDTIEMGRCARDLQDSTDRAIIGLFGGNMFEVPQMLYRMDNYLVALSRHPEAVQRLSERLCEIYLRDLEKWLGAVGPYIDIILFGDDLGGQTGPLISPEMYRRYFKPYHQTLWMRAKELADVKVMLHCCGGVRELLPDLIDAGLDAINPVQFNCVGMDTDELKAEFGKDLTFWGGGCDTRDILPNASPELVRNHVHEQVASLSPGGGFIFQQVHNILANVPAENIAAMFDAVNDFEFR